MASGDYNNQHPDLLVISTANRMGVMHGPMTDPIAPPLPPCKISGTHSVKSEDAVSYIDGTYTFRCLHCDERIVMAFTSGGFDVGRLDQSGAQLLVKLDAIGQSDSESNEILFEHALIIFKEDYQDALAQMKELADCLRRADIVKSVVNERVKEWE